jgi:hypothetical protein
MPCSWQKADTLWSESLDASRANILCCFDDSIMIVFIAQNYILQDKRQRRGWMNAYSKRTNVRF